MFRSYKITNFTSQKNFLKRNIEGEQSEGKLKADYFRSTGTLTANKSASQFFDPWVAKETVFSASSKQYQGKNSQNKLIPSRYADSKLGNDLSRNNSPGSFKDNSYNQSTFYKSDQNGEAQASGLIPLDANSNHLVVPQPHYQSFLKKSVVRKPALDMRLKLLKEQERIRRQKNTLPNIIHCDQ